MVTTSREMLRVDGVPPETMQQLQASALQLYGRANASLLVRALIAEHLAKAPAAARLLTPAEAADTVRIELRLPRVAVAELDLKAEGRFSARNYYLTSLVLAHLGQPQLQGDEIEVLRRSNYEIAKIGTNLNQMAKAINILAKMRSGEKTPEIGKKIASLRNEITQHTNKVLRVLVVGTSIWETKGRGQKRAVRKKREI